jgi:hypothetical protein
VAISDILTLGGLLGTGILIVAYFANQADHLPSDDWRFPFANLVGSSLILASLWAEWNLPSVVVEIFWIAISLYGLIHHRKRRRA